MHAIVPPYLLARIAATREPTWARAAQAARTTLEIPREYRPVRSRIRMSIEEPGTLVFEGAPNWPISRAEKSDTWWKMPLRTSRPNPIAARAPK